MKKTISITLTVLICVAAILISVACNLPSATTDEFIERTVIRKMYWVEEGTSDNSGKIKKADLDGTNVKELITGLDYPSFLALDTKNNKMYWTNGENGITRKIQRADIDGSNVETILTGTQPYGIAVDESADKIYWLDKDGGNNKIWKSDLSGDNSSVVFNPIGSDLRDILLDVEKQKIYISDTVTPALYKYSFNGDFDQNIWALSYGSPRYIAEDTSYDRIYWTNNETSDTFISYCSKNGTGHTKIYNDILRGRTTAIAIDNPSRRIYWADPSDDAIFRGYFDESEDEVNLGISDLLIPKDIQIYRKVNYKKIIVK